MSVTKENKILASDVSTIASDAKKALPKAGDGITVSTTDEGTTVSLDNVITAGTAGPSDNATLAFGGTFTVPYIQYDEHGRVISGATRTMTMPASSTSATADRLTTPRTINVKTTYQHFAIGTQSGGVTNYLKIASVQGSASFDGSGNVTITLPSFGSRTTTDCDCDCNCDCDCGG